MASSQNKLLAESLFLVTKMNVKVNYDKDASIMSILHNS